MKNWQKKERKDARDFGGRQTKSSGNQWSDPADIKTDRFLFDSKLTDNKSFSLTREIWDKLYEEALFAFKIPVLSVQIKDLELVVLAKDDFIRLTQKKSQRG